MYHILRFDHDSVKKRQSSIEIAAVLLDAHNQDQRENLKELLSKGPANYQAENVEKSSDLYSRTYLKNLASETSESDDEDTQDRTFSLEKPTVGKINSIPSVDSNRQTGDKKETIVRSSSNSEKSLLPIGPKGKPLNIIKKQGKVNVKSMNGLQLTDWPKRWF